MVRHSRASLNSAGNAGLSFWKSWRIRSAGHVEIVFRLTIGLWNDYFPEGRANERKVILLIHAAAGTVGVPFMLNQSRTGHELQHFLFKICGYRRFGSATIWVRRSIVVWPESVGYKGKPAPLAALRRISSGVLRIAAKFGRPGKAQEIVVKLTWSESCGRHRSSERFWSGPR